ncbi:MAG TPA: glycosyltransferase family 39 protein [Chitinophagaceae bacterium]|nr:glycosyltransferase family 39 protein [Chitinophagaceae bacterium]
MILAIALIFRLWQINQPYIDIISWRQTSTAMMAENFFNNNSNIFFPEINWSGPGPSYNGREFQTVSYISALLYHVFGQQDWIGRAVAVLFGIWGNFALYRLVTKVWDKRNALAAAFVMAVSPLSILVERSFLPDPAMVSLVVTALWFFIEYLQNDKGKYLVLSAIFGSLGFLTKLPGLIVGLPALYAFIHISMSTGQLTRRRIRWVVSAGSIALIPVIIYYLWARHLSLTYPPYHFAGEGNWVWNEGLIVYLKNRYFFRYLLVIAEYMMWGPILMGLFLLGMVVYPPSKASVSGEKIDDNAPYFFHFWVIAFAIFYLIGARELTVNFWNFHILSPAIAAFAGRSVVLVFDFQKRRGILPVLRLMIVVIALCFSAYKIMKSNLDERVTKSGYKMALALKNIRQKGDLVVTLPELPGDPFPIYYSRSRGWTFPPMEIDGRFYKTSVLPEREEELIELIELLRNKKAKWFALVKKHYDFFKEQKPQFYNYLTQKLIVHEEAADYVIFDLATPFKQEEISLP